MYGMYAETYAQDETDLVYPTERMRSEGIEPTSLEFVPQQYRNLGGFATGSAGAELGN